MGGVLLWGGNKEVSRDEGGIGGPETRLGRVVKASCQLRRSNTTPAAWPALPVTQPPCAGFLPDLRP